MEEDLVEVIGGELLLETVRWVLGEEGRSKAVLGVCERKGGETREEDSPAEKRLVQIRALLSGGVAVLQ